MDARLSGNVQPFAARGLRGTLHEVLQLPGLIATSNAIPSALLTYHIADRAFEVVTLHAAVQRQGLGARLLAAGRDRARIGLSPALADYHQ
jgi:hypothetical protein